MKTVLCFGDSNTWGWDPATTVQPMPGRFSADKRWTGVLKKELGNDFTVIEEGLNARTTVVDDPINEHRNGKPYLIACVDSHFPLNLVIMMLGSNDLKVRMSMTASDIVYGIEVLVDIIRTRSKTYQNQPPQVLVLSPPPVGKLLPEDELSWQGAQEKCKQVAKLLLNSASKYKYNLFDTHSVISPDEMNLDGVHLPEHCHEKLGKAVADKIKRMQVTV